MILIITHKADFTADFVINKLNQKNIPYKRFNCEDVLDNTFSIHYNSNHRYSILGETNYSAVWFRRTKLPTIENLSVYDKYYILNEIDAFIKNLLTIIDAPWISNPTSVYRAENKLLQLKLATQIGFKIPKTLVTNSKYELITFFNECNQNIIIKPISQTRIDDPNSISLIYTNIVSANYIDDLAYFDLTPCIFQENISKEIEIRVTVVGNKVFAASVMSQEHLETKTDWRKMKLKFSTIQLPSEIEKMCIKLINTFNLQFGALDLIRTPENEYIFLEVNPNGQWAWIENQTGLNISDAIITELTK